MKEITDLEAAGDIEGAKRIRNIISAYESRIGKQLTAANFEHSVSVRDSQLKTVMQVLRSHLSPEKLARVK